MREIERTATDYVLSINHEVEHAIAEGVRHLNVSRLLSAQRWLKRTYRAPYWLRPGYAEELYAIRPKL